MSFETRVIQKSNHSQLSEVRLLILMELAYIQPHKSFNRFQLIIRKTWQTFVIHKFLDLSTIEKPFNSISLIDFEKLSSNVGSTVFWEIDQDY